MSTAGDAESHGGRVKRWALVFLTALAVVIAGCAEAYLPGSGPNGPGLTALTVTPSGAAIAGATQQQFTAKTGAIASRNSFIKTEAEIFRAAALLELQHSLPRLL